MNESFQSVLRYVQDAICARCDPIVNVAKENQSFFRMKDAIRTCLPALDVVGIGIVAWMRSGVGAAPLAEGRGEEEEEGREGEGGKVRGGVVLLCEKGHGGGVGGQRGRRMRRESRRRRGVLEVESRDSDDARRVCRSLGRVGAERLLERSDSQEEEDAREKINVNGARALHCSLKRIGLVNR